MTTQAIAPANIPYGWLAYAAILVVHSITNLITRLLVGQANLGSVLLLFVAELTVISGVLANLFGKPLGFRLFWQGVNALFLLTLTVAIAMVLALAGFGLVDNYTPFISALLILALLFPAQWQLYQYAHGNPHPWSVANTG